MWQGARDQSSRRNQSEQEREDSEGRRESNTSQAAQEQGAQHLTQFNLLKDPKSEDSLYQSCKSSRHRVGVMDIEIPHCTQILSGRVGRALEGI